MFDDDCSPVVRWTASQLYNAYASITSCLHRMPIRSGKREQIEFLVLDKSGIHIVESMATLPLGRCSGGSDRNLQRSRSQAGGNRPGRDRYVQLGTGNGLRGNMDADWTAYLAELVGAFTAAQSEKVSPRSTPSAATCVSSISRPIRSSCWPTKRR